MLLDDLHKEWEIDSNIDSTNLGTESLNTPKLHSKYLRFLTESKLTLRKAESDFLRLRALKIRYYRGEMTKDELLAQKWNQWQGNKPLKSEMDGILETDGDVIRADEKVSYHSAVVSALESILKELNSRHWAIKSSIEYTKMQNGLI